MASDNEERPQTAAAALVAATHPRPRWSSSGTMVKVSVNGARAKTWPAGWLHVSSQRRLEQQHPSAGDSTEEGAESDTGVELEAQLVDRVCHNIENAHGKFQPVDGGGYLKGIRLVYP